MNTAFMEEYYNLKYENTFILQAITEHAECRELYEKIMHLEGMVEEALRNMGKEYLQLHSNLFTEKGKMDELITRLAYLKGAEDREKMLR